MCTPVVSCLEDIPFSFHATYAGGLGRFFKPLWISSEDNYFRGSDDTFA